MLSLLRSRLCDPLRRFLIGCLLVAVPVYGLAGTIVEVLGSRHLHAAAATSGSMAGWHDFRRADHAGASADTHEHARLERHHHATGDPGVVAIDGAAQDGGLSDDAGSAPTGAGLHVLALAGNPEPALPCSSAFAWHDSACERLVSRPPSRLERPPKA